MGTAKKLNLKARIVRPGAARLNIVELNVYIKLRLKLADDCRLYFWYVSESFTKR